MADARHRWKFHRLGGLDQVSIETGADLDHLAELDPKLWVALSCPVKGLELDGRTLELLDLDKDGRVRVPELLQAIAWCKPRLRDLGTLIRPQAALPLEAVNAATAEGKALLAAAARILAGRGKAGALAIAVEDVKDLSRVFEGSRFNGDGIVIPESADDPETQQLISEMVASTGGATDRSGKPGVDAAKVAAFFEELQAFVAWQAAQPGGELGALHDAVTAALIKVDEFFRLCRVAAYQPVLLKAAEAGGDLLTQPLAPVEPGAALPLSEGGRANPAYEGLLASLRAATGTARLSEADWTQLKARIAPHAAWIAAKKGGSVEALGLARAQAILASDGRARIEALIARDLLDAAEANAIDDVVRLVHYHRDLHTLLRNFIHFGDFYSTHESAIFQAGTLYLDSRSCELCVRIDDPGAHATLALLSHIYIAYCDLRRAGETMKVAACFTQGDSDYLMVGRNGIFYDRQGRDWDATITRIIDNPISIRQAFWSPYKKAIRFVEQQVQKFAEAREKEADAHLQAGASGVPAAAAPQAVDVGKMVGIIAALGVGAGALGTLFGALISGFVGLQPWWAKLFALCGIVLCISGPSMLIAWLKLRQRTLGPVLEATGWAINGRVKINIPLGTSLTGRAVLPSGAVRSLEDPFEDKRARRRRRVIWAALLAIAAIAWLWHLHTTGKL